MTKGFAIIDMDGTILSKRTVDVLCEEFGRLEELKMIDEEASNLTEREVASKVARLFNGIRRRDLERVFDGIPLNPGIEDFLAFLKKSGLKIAIATDSYQFLAERLSKKLGVDLVFGNKVEFTNDIFSGNLSSRYPCMKIPCCREYSVCKLRILLKLKTLFDGVSIAIGDGGSDLCMMQKADMGVAFRPRSSSLRKVAKIIVSNFDELREALRQMPPFNQVGE